MKSIFWLQYIIIYGIKNIYWKMVCVFVEGVILFYIFEKFVRKSINRMVFYIKIILIIYIILIIILLFYSISSSKKKRKIIEQNSKDYTVGFYFIEKYDEIMYRISKAHLCELKNKFPDKYKEFILEIQNKLNKEI